jgi:hypothetical protein
MPYIWCVSAVCIYSAGCNRKGEVRRCSMCIAVCVTITLLIYHADVCVCVCLFVCAHVCACPLKDVNAFYENSQISERD